MVAVFCCFGTFGRAGFGGIADRAEHHAIDFASPDGFFFSDEYDSELPHGESAKRRGNGVAG